jgi:phosphoribosyl-AMP cyclohydrolase
MNKLRLKQIETILDRLKYDSNGRVTVVVQDVANNEVLMVAHANREAIRQTVETGETHFWSRSRGTMWRKGETSGHVQRVREIRIDCDADVVLVKVEQVGGACHKGYRSCFFRQLRNGVWVLIAEKIFDPDKVY